MTATSVTPPPHTRENQSVCYFLYGIDEKQLKNQTKSVKRNGLCPRVQGNTNDPDTLYLSLPQSMLYASSSVMPSSNALLLPGRILGYSHDDLQLLIIYQGWANGSQRANCGSTRISCGSWLRSDNLLASYNKLDLSLPLGVLIV